VLSDLSTLLLSAASPPGTVGTTSITWTKRPDFRQQWLSQKKTARKPEDILEDDLQLYTFYKKIKKKIDVVI
jgi:hypothetical protein